MATINLAPGSRYLVAARLRRQRLFILSAIGALILAGIWGGLFFVQQQLQKTQGTLRNQLAAINAQIELAQSEARRIVLFEGRLAVIDNLLNSHLDWNPLLIDLEKFLLPTVALGRMELDSSKGTVLLEGYTNDMDQVAQTVASLTNAAGHATLFSEANVAQIQEEIVKLPNTEQQIKRYHFSLSLTFDPAKLRRQLPTNG